MIPSIRNAAQKKVLREVPTFIVDPEGNLTVMGAKSIR